MSKLLSSLLRSTFGILGSGVITGASDDGSPGIETYSQIGVQFGLGLSSMATFLYPLIAVVQEMCARIGIVTGSGLARVIKKKNSATNIIAKLELNSI